MIWIPHDHVIDNFNFQELAGPDQVAGDLYVPFGRLRLPAGMVVLCDAPGYVQRVAETVWKEAGLAALTVSTASHNYSLESQDRTSPSRCQEGPRFPFVGRSFSQA